jgi:hypothetical protein
MFSGKNTAKARLDVTTAENTSLRWYLFTCKYVGLPTFLLWFPGAGSAGELLLAAPAQVVAVQRQRLLPQARLFRLALEDGPLNRW